MTPDNRKRKHYIASEAEATEMAAGAMARMGFEDARPESDAGATGLSIVSERAVARVAFSGQPNIGDLQRLGAIHELEPDMALLAFSANGYSDATRDFAENARIALFIYDPLGGIDAVNDHAVPFEQSLLDEDENQDGGLADDERQESASQEESTPASPTAESTHPPADESGGVQGPRSDSAQSGTAAPTEKARKRSRLGWWWRWPVLAIVVFCWTGAVFIGLGTIGDSAYWGNLAFYGIPAILGTIGLQWSRKRRTLEQP